MYKQRKFKIRCEFDTIRIKNIKMLQPKIRIKDTNSKIKWEKVCKSDEKISYTKLVYNNDKYTIDMNIKKM